MCPSRTHLCRCDRSRIFYRQIPFLVRSEYRLIDNEKNLVVEKKDSENLANFDDLFDALSIRMSEINGYIDELKEMRTNIISTTNKLEEDKEKLNLERMEFNKYKQREESKINKEKESLKVNFSRLQTIINDLDKKLEDLED